MYSLHVRLQSQHDRTGRCWKMPAGMFIILPLVLLWFFLSSCFEPQSVSSSSGSSYAHGLLLILTMPQVRSSGFVCLFFTSVKQHPAKHPHINNAADVTSDQTLFKTFKCNARVPSSVVMFASCFVTPHSLCSLPPSFPPSLLSSLPPTPAAASPASF